MRTSAAITIVLFAVLATGGAIAQHVAEDEVLAEALGGLGTTDEDSEQLAAKKKKAAPNAQPVYQMEVGNSERNPVTVNVPTAAQNAAIIHNDATGPKKAKGTPGRVDTP